MSNKENRYLMVGSMKYSALGADMIGARKPLVKIVRHIPNIEMDSSTSDSVEIVDVTATPSKRPPIHNPTIDQDIDLDELADDISLAETQMAYTGADVVEVRTPTKSFLNSQSKSDELTCGIQALVEQLQGVLSAAQRNQPARDEHILSERLGLLEQRLALQEQQRSVALQHKPVTSTGDSQQSKPAIVSAEKPLSTSLDAAEQQTSHHSRKSSEPRDVHFGTYGDSLHDIPTHDRQQSFPNERKSRRSDASKSRSRSPASRKSRLPTRAGRPMENPGLLHEIMMEESPNYRDDNRLTPTKAPVNASTSSPEFHGPSFVGIDPIGTTDAYHRLGDHTLQQTRQLFDECRAMQHRILNSPAVKHTPSQDTKSVQYHREASDSRESAHLNQPKHQVVPSPHVHFDPSIPNSASTLSTASDQHVPSPLSSREDILSRHLYRADPAPLDKYLVPLRATDSQRAFVIGRDGVMNGFADAHDSGSESQNNDYASITATKSESKELTARTIYKEARKILDEATRQRNEIKTVQRWFATPPVRSARHDEPSRERAAMLADEAIGRVLSAEPVSKKGKLRLYDHLKPKSAPVFEEKRKPKKKSASRLAATFTHPLVESAQSDRRFYLSAASRAEPKLESTMPQSAVAAVGIPLGFRVELHDSEPIDDDDATFIKAPNVYSDSFESESRSESKRHTPPVCESSPTDRKSPHRRSRRDAASNTSAVSSSSSTASSAAREGVPVEIIKREEMPECATGPDALPGRDWPSKPRAAKPAPREPTSNELADAMVESYETRARRIVEEEMLLRCLQIVADQQRETAARDERMPVEDMLASAATGRMIWDSTSGKDMRQLAERLLSDELDQLISRFANDDVVADQPSDDLRGPVPDSGERSAFIESVAPDRTPPGRVPTPLPTPTPSPNISSSSRRSAHRISTPPLSSEGSVCEEQLPVAAMMRGGEGYRVKAADSAKRARVDAGDARPRKDPNWNVNQGVSAATRREDDEDTFDVDDTETDEMEALERDESFREMQKRVNGASDQVAPSAVSPTVTTPQPTPSVSDVESVAEPPTPQRYPPVPTPSPTLTEPSCSCVTDPPPPAVVTRETGKPRFDDTAVSEALESSSAASSITPEDTGDVSDGQIVHRTTGGGVYAAVNTNANANAANPAPYDEPSLALSEGEVLIGPDGRPLTLQPISVRPAPGIVQSATSFGEAPSIGQAPSVGQAPSGTAISEGQAPSTGEVTQDGIFAASSAQHACRTDAVYDCAVQTDRPLPRKLATRDENVRDLESYLRTYCGVDGAKIEDPITVRRHVKKTDAPGLVRFENGIEPVATSLGEHINDAGAERDVMAGRSANRDDNVVDVVETLTRAIARGPSGAFVVLKDDEARTSGGGGGAAVNPAYDTSLMQRDGTPVHRQVIEDEPVRRRASDESVSTYDEVKWLGPSGSSASGRMSRRQSTGGEATSMRTVTAKDKIAAKNIVTGEDFAAKESPSDSDNRCSYDEVRRSRDRNFALLDAIASQPSIVVTELSSDDDVSDDESSHELREEVKSTPYVESRRSSKHTDDQVNPSQTQRPTEDSPSKPDDDALQTPSSIQTETAGSLGPRSAETADSFGPLSADVCDYPASSTTDTTTALAPRRPLDRPALIGTESAQGVRRKFDLSKFSDDDFEDDFERDVILSERSEALSSTRSEAKQRIRLVSLGDDDDDDDDDFAETSDIVEILSGGESELRDLVVRPSQPRSASAAKATDSEQRTSFDTGPSEILTTLDSALSGRILSDDDDDEQEVYSDDDEDAAMRAAMVAMPTAASIDDDTRSFTVTTKEGTSTCGVESVASRTIINTVSLNDRALGRTAEGTFAGFEDFSDEADDDDKQEADEVNANNSGAPFVTAPDPLVPEFLAQRPTTSKGRTSVDTTQPSKGRAAPEESATIRLDRAALNKQARPTTSKGRVTEARPTTSKGRDTGKSARSDDARSNTSKDTSLTRPTTSKGRTDDATSQRSTTSKGPQPAPSALPRKIKSKFTPQPTTTPKTTPKVKPKATPTTTPKATPKSTPKATPSGTPIPSVRKAKSASTSLATSKITPKATHKSAPKRASRFANSLELSDEELQPMTAELGSAAEDTAKSVNVLDDADQAHSTTSDEVSEIGTRDSVNVLNLEGTLSEGVTTGATEGLISAIGGGGGGNTMPNVLRFSDATLAATTLGTTTLADAAGETSSGDLRMSKLSMGLIAGSTSIVDDSAADNELIERMLAEGGVGVDFDALAATPDLAPAGDDIVDEFIKDEQRIKPDIKVVEASDDSSFIDSIRSERDKPSEGDWVDGVFVHRQASADLPKELQTFDPPVPRRSAKKPEILARSIESSGSAANKSDNALTFDTNSGLSETVGSAEVDSWSDELPSEAKRTDEENNVIDDDDASLSSVPSMHI